MTNLSDLFPAGAGKQVSFVADGSISAAGKPVILTAAGKAAEVGLVTGSASIGTPVEVQSATCNSGFNAVLDEASGKMVMVFSDQTDDDGYCSVGTITGTAISWATPVKFFTGSMVERPCLCYDPVEEQVIIGYAASSSTNSVITGKVSGTSMTFGTAVVVDSTNDCRDITLAYDIGQSKALVVYGCPYEASNAGRAKVITVTGTAIALGTVLNWDTGAGGNDNYFTSAYDVNASKIVFSKRDGDNQPKAAVFSISGTTPSVGTFVNYSGSSNTTECKITYDSTANKIVTAYRHSTSTYGYATVGTVSGTSISFGTTLAFISSAITAATVAVAYAGDSADVTYSLLDKQNKYALLIILNASKKTVFCNLPPLRYNILNTR